MRLCENCTHFHSAPVLVRGELWSDDLMAVPALKGVCRASPPQSTFWGSRWPTVRSFDTCGQFSPAPRDQTPMGEEG